MFQILNSHHIGSTKLKLFFVRGAQFEPSVDWEWQGMFYSLVEVSQGHVVFPKI